MLNKESKLWCSDNSGIRVGKLLNIRNKGGKEVSAFFGDYIKFSIRKTKSLKKYVKNKIYMGLVLTQKKKKLRLDGSYIHFNKSTFVSVNDNYKIYGSRIMGPVTKEVFMKNRRKDLSRLYLLSKRMY